MSMMQDRSIFDSSRLAQASRGTADAKGRRAPSRLLLRAARGSHVDDMAGIFGRRGSFFEVASPERH